MSFAGLNSSKQSFVELQKINQSGLDNKIEYSDIQEYPPSTKALTIENERDDFPLLDQDEDSEDRTEGSGSAGSGVLSAVFNLATTVIGAGIMALPATLKVLGIPIGLLFLVVMGLVSEVTIEILVRFSVLMKASTYGETVQCACGNTARVISEICIVVNNAGVMIVYLIIIGDVMSGSSNHHGLLNQWIGNDNGWWAERRLTVLITLVFVLAPLCALRRIDSLKFTSAASVALAVVFVVLCSIIALVKVIEGKIEKPRMVPDFGSRTAILDLLVVIPIMTNAFVCHFNVQPIYNELQGKSPPKMNTVSRITTVLCLLIYASTAVSGYLLFGQSTDSDILTNFDRELDIPFSTILDNIIRGGYVLHLMLVFPVIHFSLRQTIDCLIFKDSKPLSESTARFYLLTLSLLTLLYLGSSLVPNIWVAFQFTGATSGLALGFIFPALICLRGGDRGNLGWAGKLLAGFIFVLALIVSVIGVVGNILDLATGTK